MQLISSEIEKYCIEKSSTPSAYLDELFSLTHKTQELPQMLIGQMEASFLGFLIRSQGMNNILEIGTFTGYSALCMAENLPINGKITTVDINEKPVEEIAKPIWNKSPNGIKIKSFIMQGLDFLNQTDDKYDLVFIDADKKNYLKYVEFSLNTLSTNGIILVDNALWSGDVINREKSDDSTSGIRKLNDWAKNQENLYTTLLPIRDGLLLIKPISH